MKDENVIEWLDNELENNPKLKEKYEQFRPANEFLARVDLALENKKLPVDFGISEHRLDKLYDKPTKLKYMEALQLARAVGLRLSLVAYDSEKHVSNIVFAKCWEMMGKPANMWDLEGITIRRDKND